ncbi:nitric-oxide reductase [Candidatus Nitrosoglobus terrae]|uniref:Nitric-oxide reductase n=1 Tax=Candidatus Nitrosoglobus terrae TaxID=1630141 RepID=A0A1Q2SK38_9GAMM|nr:cbb3-type cytochrome c oxidase subunit I [Candidatus Nitrosoglobus terrae]BAW79484.1 nitric-oxide reductase [Candidatus Nitrosoglobus terrae]
MKTFASASNEDSGPLSPWWIRSIIMVMVIGFALLLSITHKAYHNAPPIPLKIEDIQGNILFTSDDISGGQEVFLKYGLMNNGSIWGHGAYLGPDYSATALHRIGEGIAATLAQERYHKNMAQLTLSEQAAVRAEVTVMLKTNRYDSATGVLKLTPAETEAYRQEIKHWTDYFKDPTTNGGLKPDTITDSTELQQFTAFVTWAAWASVANRPDENFSYTNNFPYDPSVGNQPTSGALLWSALSLVVLLGGIGAVLLSSGRFEFLGWSGRHQGPPHILLGQASPGQRALVKFFVVVALLFFIQTLLGGAAAHSRAEPGDFYGLPIDKIFPSNLIRTWHLQTAIFWIATAYVAAALFLGRTLRDDEPDGLTTWVNRLFCAFAVVIGASLLGEWLGMVNMLGDFWFWIGNQGWEFLEIGRLWQYLLVAGLLIWFGVLWWLAHPRKVSHPEVKPLARMFLLTSLAIPIFYIPALFYGAKTNFTVVDTWRFWIIHLWVEGFFELFATTVVALVFFKIGLVSRNTALRAVYFDCILVFLGGLVGTGHHWYFNGQTHFNMALSGLFSVIEVVPLTLITLEAWGFVQTARSGQHEQGNLDNLPHKWTFYFLMAVGFWNFTGAGVFGLLVNLPIVSYYETGTILTPNHGHAAFMGVFGMLAIAMMAFVLRQTTEETRWPSIEKYFKMAFFGTNIGLGMMIVMSLFPGGVLQVWDVLQNGYWHARSLEYTASDTARLLEWLRLPGDVVFIVFGSLPLLIAATKGWLSVRATSTESR